MVSFGTDLQNLAEYWPAQYTTDAGGMGGMLSIHGCDFMSSIGTRLDPYGNLQNSSGAVCGQRLVNGFATGQFALPVKALNTLCPVTCACKAGDLGCPSSCNGTRIIPYDTSQASSGGGGGG